MATKKKKKTETRLKKPKVPARSVKKVKTKTKPKVKVKTKVKPKVKAKVKPKTKPKVKPGTKTQPRRKSSLKVTKVAVKKVPQKKLFESVRAKTSHEAARNQILRKQLIKRREEIVREAKTEIAKYIKGEANQLVETALDDGDWSVIDLSADINLKLLESHRGSLLKIDESLRKLKEGSYGVCEDCGGEISSERLNVMPFAIYCRDCQEKREEIEKVEREEIIS